MPQLEDFWKSLPTSRSKLPTAKPHPPTPKQSLQGEALAEFLAQPPHGLYEAKQAPTCICCRHRVSDHKSRSDASSGFSSWTGGSRRQKSRELDGEGAGPSVRIVVPRILLPVPPQQLSARSTSQLSVTSTPRPQTARVFTPATPRTAAHTASERPQQSQRSRPLSARSATVADALRETAVRSLQRRGVNVASDAQRKVVAESYEHSGAVNPTELLKDCLLDDVFARAIKTAEQIASEDITDDLPQPVQEDSSAKGMRIRMSDRLSINVPPHRRTFLKFDPAAARVWIRIAEVNDRQYALRLEQMMKDTRSAFDSYISAKQAVAAAEEALSATQAEVREVETKIEDCKARISEVWTSVIGRNPMHRARTSSTLATARHAAVSTHSIPLPAHHTDSAPLRPQTKTSILSPTVAFSELTSVQSSTSLATTTTSPPAHSTHSIHSTHSPHGVNASSPSLGSFSHSTRLDIMKARSHARAMERKLEEQISDLRASLVPILERLDKQRVRYQQAVATAAELHETFDKLLQVEDISSLSPRPLSARAPTTAGTSALSSFRQSTTVPTARPASALLHSPRLDRLTQLSARASTIPLSARSQGQSAAGASGKQTPRATFSPVIKSIPSLHL